MHCAVFGCNNSNISKHVNFHFFGFPKNKKLQTKWIKFSQRADAMNVKTARICNAHFKNDDYENLMQFEMGYSKSLLLKAGTCPSIAPKPVTSTYVKTRLKKTLAPTSNKIVSSTLVQESGEIETFEFDLLEPAETTTSEVIEVSEDHFMDKDSYDEITDLKEEIDSLKDENNQLRKDNDVMSEQIKNIYLPKIIRLKKQLMKAEFKNQYMDDKLREIFKNENSKDIESVWLLAPGALGKTIKTSSISNTS